MVTLIVNPTVVTVSFKSSLDGFDGPVIIASDESGQVLAELYRGYLTPMYTSPILLMRDTKTSIVYRSNILDGDKSIPIDQVIEAMLNVINLTSIERKVTNRD